MINGVLAGTPGARMIGGLNLAGTRGGMRRSMGQERPRKHTQRVRRRGRTRKRRDKGPCLGKGNPQNPKAEVAKEKGKGATSKAKDPRFGLATKEGVEKLFGSAVLRGTKSSKKAPKPDPDAGANGAKVEEPRDPNEEDWEEVDPEAEAEAEERPTDDEHDEEEDDEESGGEEAEQEDEERAEEAPSTPKPKTPYRSLLSKGPLMCMCDTNMCGVSTVMLLLRIVAHLFFRSRLIGIVYVMTYHLIPGRCYLRGSFIHDIYGLPCLSLCSLESTWRLFLQSCSLPLDVSNVHISNHSCQAIPVRSPQRRYLNRQLQHCKTELLLIFMTGVPQPAVSSGR